MEENIMNNVEEVAKGKGYIAKIAAGVVAVSACAFAIAKAVKRKKTEEPEEPAELTIVTEDDVEEPDVK